MLRVNDSVCRFSIHPTITCIILNQYYLTGFTRINQNYNTVYHYKSDTDSNNLLKHNEQYLYSYFYFQEQPFLLFLKYILLIMKVRDGNSFTPVIPMHKKKKKKNTWHKTYVPNKQLQCQKPKLVHTTDEHVIPYKIMQFKYHIDPPLIANYLHLH